MKVQFRPRSKKYSCITQSNHLHRRIYCITAEQTRNSALLEQIAKFTCHASLEEQIGISLILNI